MYICGYIEKGREIANEYDFRSYYDNDGHNWSKKREDMY